MTYNKLFLISVKYMPVIQTAGMLLSNSSYYKDIYIIGYIMDFIVGDCLLFAVLLFLCNKIFTFCIWHKFIVLANLINALICTIDRIYKINISDKDLLVLYYMVAGIFILIATYTHIKRKDKKHEYKT